MHGQASCSTAGRWRCSRSRARTTPMLDQGQTPGVTYGVEWVTIDDPDPTFAPGTTNDQAIQAVGAQGRAKGAAMFSRLEGIFYDSGKVYLVSTQGGDTPARRAAAGRLRRRLRPAVGLRHDAGDAHAAVRVAQPHRARAARQPLHQPAKCSLLCEDGPTRTTCAGVTPDGEIFDFARNAIPRRAGRGVRRRDLHARRQGAVRQHPGQQRPDVRDLGAVEARRALAPPP